MSGQHHMVACPKVKRGTNKVLHGAFNSGISARGKPIRQTDTADRACVRTQMCFLPFFNFFPYLCQYVVNVVSEGSWSNQKETGLAQCFLLVQRGVPAPMCLKPREKYEDSEEPYRKGNKRNNRTIDS
eukprot:5976128-Amphidinium_carterae.1